MRSCALLWFWPWYQAEEGGFQERMRGRRGCMCKENWGRGGGGGGGVIYLWS